MVNRNRIEKVLKLFCEHNPAFRSYGIKLDKEALYSLPYNYIPFELPTCVDKYDTIDSYILETELFPVFFPVNDSRHKWLPISPLVCFNPTVCGSRRSYPLTQPSA